MAPNAKLGAARLVLLHLSALVLVAVAVGPRLGAQPASRLVTVHGVAWDSLRGGPLQGALITIGKMARTTTSDSVGHFRFDSVPPGITLFTIVHPAFDTIGITVPPKRVLLDGRNPALKISIPSLASYWRAACGPGAVPQDSAILFGATLDAESQKPLPGAAIAVRWSDLAYEKTAGVQQRQWGGQAISDSAGAFRLCGVPSDLPLWIVATSGHGTTGPIELNPLTRRIQRRDLLVNAKGDSTLRGTIQGHVLDKDARPVAGARIVAEGVAVAQSSSDGRFILRSVPIGTRQLRALSIGSNPVATIVDVSPNDTTYVALELSKVVSLESVNVRARSLRQRRLAELQQRRAIGVGNFMDSTRIETHATATHAISMMAKLSDVCALFIDGVQAELSEVRFRAARDLALLETHRGTSINLPEQYRVKKCQSATRITVLAWTKIALP
jgi:hypothetical protein